MQLSIIIPTYNEEEGITRLLTHLQKIKSNNVISEIIVVDGGSVDKTQIVTESLFCHPEPVEGFKQKRVLKSEKGRAKQLNVGAHKATGKILYFLHADTYPPKGFDLAILSSINEKTQAGSFGMKFDKNTLFFNFWSWFTRFKWDIASGGDQSLFVTKILFNKMGGFNEDWIIMEDIEIMSRIKATTNYVKLFQEVTTSTRKYDKTGALKLQYHFIIMHNLKMLGVSPERLFQYYKKKIKN